MSKNRFTAQQKKILVFLAKRYLGKAGEEFIANIQKASCSDFDESVAMIKKSAKN